MSTSPELLDAFIEAACIPIGPGSNSHCNGDLDAANKILETHPRIADDHFYAAVILGEAKIVSDLIAKDHALVIKRSGRRNWDALTYLCFSRYLRLDPKRSEGFVLTAEVLLNNGADANTGFYEEEHHPNREWEPVLYGAAGIAQHPGVTRLLLEHGADPNDGEVAYHSPETYDNETLQVLIASGKLSQDTLATMLLRKADFHDGNGMKLLLEAGADPNRITIWKFTALHQSLRRDNGLEMIELLLDHGADPLLPNGIDGRSAVSIAIDRGRADVLNAFQKRNIGIKPAGVRKLLFACAMNDTNAMQKIVAAEPELVKEILAKGASPLSEFAGTANADGVAQLLELGVPVTALYHGDGYFGIPGNSTALHVAAWKAWPDVVKVLIEKGAPVNAVDGYGQTPLMLAVRACVDSYWTYRRKPTSIQLLLAAGASIEGIKIPTGYDEADKLLSEK